MNFRYWDCRPHAHKNLRRRRPTMLMVKALALGMAINCAALGQKPYTQITMPYESLNEKARALNDETSVRALLDEIAGQVGFGSLPPAIQNRIVRAEIALGRGEAASVQEAAIADAVNVLGQAIAPGLYTRTNEKQVRMLRVAMFKNVPKLVQSPTPPPADNIVGPDMSPSGAIYVSLLLLHQKLVNPVWIGDPDEWVSRFEHATVPQERGTRARLGTGTSFPGEYAAPPGGYAALEKARIALSENNSTINSRFHSFLDRLAISR